MLKIKDMPENKMAYKKIEHIQKDIRKAVNLAYDNIGQTLKKQVIFDLDDKDNKHGRLYIIHKHGRVITHRASAPGEPPATLFGNLKRSIEVKSNDSDRMTISAGNQEAKYAIRLELGDDKVAKRPYLKKAIRDHEKNIENYFIKYLKECLGTYNEA